MKRVIRGSVMNSEITNPQSEYEYRRKVYLRKKHEFETLGEDDNNDVLSREEKMNIAKAEMDKVANDDVYSADDVDDIESEFQRIDRSGTDEEVAIAAIMYNLGTTMREAREILPTLSEDKIKDYVDYYYLRDLPRSKRIEIWNNRKNISSSNVKASNDYINSAYEYDVSDWRELASKSVEDSDGFNTDYTLYTNGETYICMFGDKDLYEPDASYADYETESEQDAWDWFNSYTGFADEEDDDDLVFIDPEFDEYDVYGSGVKASTGEYYLGNTWILSKSDESVESCSNVKSLRKIHASWNYYPYALYSYTPGDSETGIEGDKFDIIDVVKSADENEAKRYFKNKRMWYPNYYVDKISEEDYNAFLKEQEELDRYESAVTSYNGFADEEDEYDADDYDEIYSANYGGAYDVDPEQYFTREDLVEFADDVVDRLNVISYSKFDYTEVYLEPGNDLELTIVWSDYEDTIKEHIDMRKIRKPSDLCKVYAPLFVNRAKEVFSEYGADFGPHYEEDEIYSSKQSNSKLNQIKDKITKVVKKVMMSAEFGFPEDEVEEYSVVEVDPSGKVEVRAEVGYDGLMTLCDALNPIVQRYDKDSYFEPVQPGIIQAWIENKNDVVESSKSPNSVANKYPEYMKVSRGGQDFSVHYNLIDNSPSADAHKMWLEFQASVSAIKPYDDAEYAWAQIENGHINVIKGGKVIQQYYYFDADDMDVENSEWCDAIIEQAIDYISEINDKVESRMVHNSTSTKGETIEAGYYDVPERPLDPPEYDDPVEEDPIQEICEFSFDVVVILDKDGGWDYENNDYSFAANPDDKQGDWYTYEDHIYLTDQTGMVEDLDDLIEPMMPAGPGKYRIQGDATMVFDVDNLYAYYDYYRDGSYDKELLKDDAEVTFNYQESKVENFKFIELN